MFTTTFTARGQTKRESTLNFATGHRHATATTQEGQVGQTVSVKSGLRKRSQGSTRQETTLLKLKQPRSKKDPFQEAAVAVESVGLTLPAVNHLLCYHCDGFVFFDVGVCFCLAAVQR